MYFNDIVTQGFDKMVHFRIMEDDTDNKICEADCSIQFLENNHLTNLGKQTGKEIYYFGNFGTFPKYRGKGYARKMLQHVKEYYKGKIIYLFVCAAFGGSLDDSQLIKFYESEGFKLYESDYDWPLMIIEL